MIITLTMNPALDKTMEVESLNLGGLNRVQNVQVDAGGKGINVSKMIDCLGGTGLTTGFVGGESGDKLLKIVEKLGLKHDFTTIVGKTRTNIKVFDKKYGITELNETGIILTAQDEQNICDKLVELADEKAIFVLSGSLPVGVETNFYQKLITLLKEKAAKVFLDADGEAFKLGIKAKPNYIKPNLYELTQYFNVSEDISLIEIKELCHKLIDSGIELVAVSMGKKGAMFVTSEKALYAEGLDVKAASTVGAGDSMIGAMVYGMEQKMPLEDLIKLSMAAASGAVMTEGTKPPTYELVEQLKGRVELKKI
jgi:1-phosphofructokinase